MRLLWVTEANSDRSLKHTNVWFHRPSSSRLPAEPFGGEMARKSRADYIQPGSWQSKYLKAEDEYVLWALCTVFFSFDHSLTHVQIQTTINSPLNRLYRFFPSED